MKSTWKDAPESQKTERHKEEPNIIQFIIDGQQVKTEGGGE